MFKHFYRLMVVALAALTATAATGCGGSDYGAQYVPFDNGTVDEDVAEEEVVDEDTADVDKNYNDGDYTDYGCPTTEYRIEGVVVSTAGVPIRGIKIALSEESVATAGLEVGFAPEHSGSKGEFSLWTIDECSSSPSTGPFTLIVEDVDGAQNGQFLGTKKSVLLDCGDYVSWENYCTKTDVKIELQEAVSDDDNLLSDEETSDDDTLLKD